MLLECIQLYEIDPRLQTYLTQHNKASTHITNMYKQQIHVCNYNEKE